MSGSTIVVTIEPDGVRADNFVVTVAVDGVERERHTWASLERAIGRVEVAIRRLGWQVFR